MAPGIVPTACRKDWERSGNARWRMLRPMVETYRSYVVRVRRRADAAEAVQIDVEDLIGGGRTGMNGDEARWLAELLRSLVVQDQNAGLATIRNTIATIRAMRNRPPS